MKYLFIGQSYRFYPDVFVNARSLEAMPGDVVEFEGEPPNDGLWVPFVEPQEIELPRPNRAKSAKEN